MIILNEKITKQYFKDLIEPPHLITALVFANVSSFVLFLVLFLAFGFHTWVCVISIVILLIFNIMVVYLTNIKKRYIKDNSYYIVKDVFINCEIKHQAY